MAAEYIQAEDLPENWITQRVGDFASVKGGKRLPAGTALIDKRTDHPYLRIVDFRDGRIDQSNLMFVPENVFPRISRYTISAKDVWISIVGTVGLVGLIDETLDGANLTENAAKICNIASHVDKAFLSFFLRSQPGREQIRAQTVGSTQPKLALFRIEDIRVSLPPLFEQRAIAHVLGTLDDKIELNRRRNQTLEAMARALFKDWFVDFGPVRAKMEGREPYLPAELWQLFPDRLDEEGKPEGWEMQPLSELLTIIGGGTPKTSVEEYWGGDIPWFSVVDTPSASDVFVIATEKTITDKGLAGSSARLIPKGTTIISARGTVGNLAIAGCNMTFNQSCYGLRGTGSAGEYFVYLTAQQMVDQLKSMAHGSVFSTITRQTFEAIQRPVPSPTALAAFERLATGWFDSIFSSVEESRTLAQLRDTLLPKLISGELRIDDAQTFLKERGL